eukprot:scaffold18109_cov37-Prasinocladus_malaysianus.AAC.1
MGRPTPCGVAAGGPETLAAPALALVPARDWAVQICSAAEVETHEVVAPPEKQTAGGVTSRRPKTAVKGPDSYKLRMVKKSSRMQQHITDNF